MRYTIMVPRKIQNDFETFEFFGRLFFETKDIENTTIELDFKKTRWFEAQLTAVLGAIFAEIAKKQNNTICISNISSSVRMVFQKNNFYKTFGLSELEDEFKTTIKFSVFKAEDNRFSHYVREDFIPKLHINMSPGFIKELRLGMEELFQNTRIHANCKYVFTCGQCYYKKNDVKFAIVDIGKTIKTNVCEKLKMEINACDAIEWATVEGNTTKKEGEIGGFGLAILESFLEKNKGTFQIISAEGFWEKRGNIITKKLLKYPFPGTIINLEVNAEDTNIYVTEYEQRQLSNIF
ncbi:hypothetical protein [Bacillus cereus]|uniref:hypothetical protein n=1 Tax=Bacillus cereus TaxID=1396 RepID=UPI0002F0840D|nr:hypothetical protein [Bacillus cereus]